MRLILPLVLIAFASSVQAQDTIEWSDKRKLTFADFRKVPDIIPSAQHIISRYGVRTEFDSGQVTALFYPNDSWLDQSNKTGLQYSNTIFDIYEWACREFRKRLAEKHDFVLAEKVKEIGEDVDKEFITIFEAYDSETQYGSNLLEQMKWESRINQQLYMLANYCKNCREPKIN